MNKAFVTTNEAKVLDMTEHYRRAGRVLNAADESSMRLDQADWAALGWRMTKAALWITVGFVAGLVVAAIQYSKIL